MPDVKKKIKKNSVWKYLLYQACMGTLRSNSETAQVSLDALLALKQIHLSSLQLPDKQQGAHRDLHLSLREVLLYSREE